MTTPEGESPDAAIAPAAPRKKRRSPMFLACAIFLCGMLTGGALGSVLWHQFMTFRFRHPERVHRQILESLEGDLELTREQRQKVERILDEKQEEFFDLMTQFDPQVEAHFDGLRDEVATALSEKQATEWKRRFEDMRKRFRPHPPPELRQRQRRDPGEDLRGP